MRYKTTPAAMAITFLLLGCVSHGVMVSDQQLQQFKQGKTTEQEVIATIGTPTSITTHNGQRFLIYAGAQAQARPAAFIPFIGPLVGGYDVRSSSVIIKVSDGVVTDITSSQSASGGGQGFAAGGPIDQVPDQPRKP